MSPQTLEFPPRADGGADTAPRRLGVEPTSRKLQTDGQCGGGLSGEVSERFEGISPEEVKIMAELMRCLGDKTTKTTEELPVQPLRLHTLTIQADVAESRFDRLGTVECILKEVECRRQALALTPDWDLARPYQLAAFGASLSRKFRRLGNLADINQAIQCLSQSIQLTADGNPDKASRFSNLGSSHRDRFEHLGELEDVAKAIQCQTQAVQLTPDGHPGKPGQLNNLGNSYLSRFERLGELADVAKAIECQTQALKLTPDGDPDKASELNNLGTSYLARFQRFGALGDMTKAIECQTQAVQVTLDEHPKKPFWLDNLGNSYRCRFERLGQLVDLAKAIESLTQAVQLTPAGHPAKPGMLNNLGNSYMRRFQRLGELVDADQAIECLNQAVQLTPDGHSSKPGRLNNLGIMYTCRFERLGELGDVAKAIECQTQTVQLTPDGHPDKPNALTNLGTSYLCRFERFGELADVAQAIECQTQVVKLIPDDHPDKPSGLINLGNSYMRRFQRLGGLVDAAQAINCHTQAAQLTPDDHPDKRNWLNNLGMSYHRRFQQLGELADADQAIEYLTQTVQLTPDSHPDKPIRLNNLGNSYLRRFEHLDELADLTHAHSIFHQGAQLVLTSPEPQFICAQNWAQTASLLGLAPQRAYERCFELLPHIIWLGTTIKHRYNLLTQVSDLATEAASWAISVQSYDLAIEWLEEGRSIVWNQILQLRTPFDNLFSVDPPLAQHLKDIAQQLESAGSRQSALEPLIESEAALETAAQHHRRLAADWEQCLKKARSIPGFQNFMQPRKAAELKAAATDGPVVIINIHSKRWDALIISPQCDEVAHVPLAMMAQSQAGDSLAHLFSGVVAGQRGERPGGFVKKGPRPAHTLKATLAGLWSIVTKPILDALNFTRKLPPDELPHVAWCATGPLASLPLHAAGPYDGSTPNTFDLVVSSYTPSLSALLASSPSGTQPDGVLAIGQQFTNGFSPLPYTSHELEAIKSHATAIHYRQLDGKNATVNAVLSAMDEHSWVHLACHATQNPENPAHSAFHLHDGDLTLESITKRQFRNKGLAFLSACQTAKGDGKLPDEAVHLAAGMLMAGYPSVIATMWSIYDEDGPEVAGRMYAELLKDGKMDHRGAARVLHKAVAVLREKIGEDSFERWVPFIHIGV